MAAGRSDFFLKPVPDEHAGRQALHGRLEETMSARSELLFMSCCIGSLPHRCDAGRFRFFKVFFLFLRDRFSRFDWSISGAFHMRIPVPFRLVSGTASQSAVEKTFH